MDAVVLLRLAHLRRHLWPLHPATGSPDPALAAWAVQASEEPGDLRGVSLEGLEPAWIEALAHAGVPLTSERGLPFARLFQPAEVPSPQMSPSGAVLVPPPTVLAGLSSLPLKPLRLAMAGIFGVRLQIGAGVHLFLGRQRAVLLNTSDRPRSGFLHGPRRGMRAALAMEAGEVQTVSLG